jgi:hypothetical protein
MAGTRLHLEVLHLILLLNMLGRAPSMLYSSILATNMERMLPSLEFNTCRDETFMRKNSSATNAFAHFRSEIS